MEREEESATLSLAVFASAKRRGRRKLHETTDYNLQYLLNYMSPRKGLMMLLCVCVCVVSLLYV